MEEDITQLIMEDKIMTKKKSGFWTFLFSWIPGAGEMYMGFMRMGISLMILFWGIIALAVFFNTEFIIYRRDRMVLQLLSCA